MSDKGGKVAQKSDNIAGTPGRSKTMEVTPNAKKASEREQDRAKKSKQDKKNNLLNFFGDGARVPAPTIAGTSIDTVTQCRESRVTGTNAPDKAGDEEGKRKRPELRKFSKITPSKVSMPEGKANKGSEPREQKTPQAGGKKGEHEVNLELINMTPLKKKGKREESKKKKKKEETLEEKVDRAKSKKKATFAETIKKEATQAQRIEYKKCVIGFAIRVDKGNNTKGGFDKKFLEGLTFMQTYIDMHALFHPIGKDQIPKPIKEKTDMPKYQVTMRSYFSIPNLRAFDNVSQDGGRDIKGLAVMGFSTDPQTCLDDASGDLRMMGCAIYYKKC
jgi:hypothetical protein